MSLLEAEVIGSSLDGERAQSGFKERNGLPYPLIGDTEGRLARAYGVLRAGYAARATFLIGKDGLIKEVWPKVDPAAHAAEVLEALRRLSGNS